MEDLTVVVTGAGSGVGLAAAKEFARRGARLIVSAADPALAARLWDASAKAVGL